jgi:hypothetical protein
MTLYIDLPHNKSHQLLVFEPRILYWLKGGDERKLGGRGVGEM